MARTYSYCKEMRGCALDSSTLTATLILAIRRISHRLITPLIIKNSERFGPENTHSDTTQSAGRGFLMVVGVLRATTEAT